jgi:hypothetical protein
LENYILRESPYPKIVSSAPTSLTSAFHPNMTEWIDNELIRKTKVTENLSKEK